MAESATTSHTVCGEDITGAIAQEKAQACGILRVRFEHFERLAQALKLCGHTYAVPSRSSY
jgi:hypothetical protein